MNTAKKTEQQNIQQASYHALMIVDPIEKCQAVIELHAAWQKNLLNIEHNIAINSLPEPGRPSTPRLVNPRELAKRSLHTKEGRIIFMHAIAHIEFNAINLALDALYRFPNMPKQYYADWLLVAKDEAKHFQLLTEYLNTHNCVYGDFDAHNGLWDMALRTEHNIVARMALVPRVLEARGLDVTPGMIKKLQAAGDRAAVDILTVIYEEEIAHVEAGSRWFNYVCEQEGLEPTKTFAAHIKEYFIGELRGPYNAEARLQAGFSEEELEQIYGVKF